MVKVFTGDRDSQVDAWRRSGIPALTGHSGASALLPPGDAARIADSLAAHVAVSAAHSGRELTIDGAGMLGERAALRGLTRRGRVSAGGFCRLLRACDGWIAVSAPRDDDPHLLAALIGQSLVETGLGGRADVPWEALSEFVSGCTLDEIGAELEMFGVTGAPVRTRTPRTSLGTPARALGLEPRSVANLTVVDFSALWAGPLCAHLLSVAGARVIKVETVDRPDGARRGDPLLFDRLHRGAEYLIVDPAQEQDRQQLKAVVARADIVIESSRPRALRSWGLDAQQFVADGGVWISLTAAGRESNRVGFGDDVAASVGLLAVDELGLPVFCGDAIADPLSGLTAAALAVSATDGGALWDCSMADIAAEAVGDQAFTGISGIPSPRFDATMSRV